MPTQPNYETSDRERPDLPQANPKGMRQRSKALPLSPALEGAAHAPAVATSGKQAACGQPGKLSSIQPDHSASERTNIELFLTDLRSNMHHRQSICH